MAKVYPNVRILTTARHALRAVMIVTYTLPIRQEVLCFFARDGCEEQQTGPLGRIVLTASKNADHGGPRRFESF